MKIKDLCELTSGYQTRTAIEADRHGSHFLLQIRDFDSERRRINPEGMIRFYPASSQQVATLRDGDVVFLAKGAKNFAAVIRGVPKPSYAAAHFFVLRPKESTLPDYLAWVLNHEVSRQYFLKFATTGANMPIVRRDVLGDMTVPLPNLATQRLIVEFEALASRQQALLAELAARKQTLATTICYRAASNQIILNSDPS